MSNATQTAGRRMTLAILLAALVVPGCGTTPAPKRTRELMRHADGVIDVIVEGSGPAIVLLPSSIRDSEDFDELAGQLARQGFRVLRPQPRGMRASTGPVDKLTLNLMASDVALVVEKLGGGSAIWVGHAFGHFVARVADLNHPRRVRGLVVLGAAQRNISQELLAALAVAGDPKHPREARLKALRLAMFAPGNDPIPWLDGWYPQLLPAFRRAAQVPSRDAWWLVSNAPILDLQGEQDPWRPPSTRNELKDVLGDKVTVKVIPNASHALVPEQPAAISAAVTEWIRSIKP